MSDTEEFDHYLYVAKLIEKYLQSRPDAMDSLDGIMNWWVTQQKLRESEESVNRALQLLLEKGVITRDSHGCYHYTAD
jgi:predicted transcriptional regulator